MKHCSVLNILYIEGGPERGGSVKSLFNLIKGLKKGGYRIFVAINKLNLDARLFEDIGSNVIFFKWKNVKCETNRFRELKQKINRCTIFKELKVIYNFFKFTKELFTMIIPLSLKFYKIIKAKQIDLVHLNDRIGYNKYGIIAAKLARVPCICHERKIAQYTGIDLFLSRYVDVLICISNAVYKNCISSGVRSKKIVVIYNGVDLEVFKPKQTKYKLMTELQLADKHVIGIIGRLDVWKGHRFFLYVASKIKEYIPNCKFLVVGETPPHLRSYLDELRGLCLKLGISHDTIFLGFRQNIAEYINIMDVVLHCSTRPEPFGRVIIEAMSLAKPVVAANYGAVPELIENNVSGIIVPNIDINRFVEATITLLKDRPKAQAIGYAARKRVEQIFNLENHVHNIKKIYESLTSCI